MAWSKKKSAPRRKMIRRKKLARRPRRLVVNRALSPIPQRYITKMKYSEVVTTNSITAQYAMNLNSIYDPNQSGVGHQPYGFDQLSALYNRYRVISCGYRVNLALGAATTPVILTALPGNQVVTTSTASEVRENPRAKYITQNPGAASVVLHDKVYCPSIVGRNKAQYMADDRYQADTASSPAEQIILNLQTFSSTDAPLGSVQVQVVMEYLVEFFDIKSLGQS